MTKLLFMRHGATDQNRKMIITSGYPGGGLNDEGRKQARSAANIVLQYAPHVIYTSPLARAQQTATELTQIVGAPVKEHVALAECDVGELEGRSGEAAFARFNSTFDAWYLQQDLSYPLGPEGETGHAAVHRLGEFIFEVSTLHPTEVIIVVSHQTLLQVGITWLSVNLQPRSGFHRWISNCGLVIVDSHDAELICRSWDGKELDTTQQGIQC